MVRHGAPAILAWSATPEIGAVPGSAAYAKLSENLQLEESKGDPIWTPANH